MPDKPPAVDFDARPPLPVGEYPRTIRGIIPGYDLLFTLTHAFLRAERREDLHLLVVGAGGGAEIAQFLPANPGWRITGVDPSSEMLALARSEATRLGVGDRVTLVQGTVADLPREARFDAATCLLVLHFLPDAEKAALLRGVAGRRRPAAPLVVAATAVAIPVAECVRDDYRRAQRHYAELLGQSPEQVAARLAQTPAFLATLPPPCTPDDYLRLLREAGFRRTGELLRIMGTVGAWYAH